MNPTLWWIRMWDFYNNTQQCEVKDKENKECMREHIKGDY